MHVYFLVINIFLGLTKVRFIFVSFDAVIEIF